VREAIKCNFKKKHQQPSIKKVTITRAPANKASIGIDYYPLHPKYCSFLLSEWISTTLFLKKRRGGVRGGVETETTMSIGEGPSSG
jgi:hypothetical protein